MIPNKVYDILINLLPMIILFSVVMFLVKIVSVIYRKEKLFVYKDIKNFVYIVYCFALFYLVTTSDFISYSNNFIPFHEIMRYEITSPLFYRNIVGNILLFIPFSYIICDMVKDKISWSNIFISAFICLVTSTTIEIIQMFIGRSFDIDDIILNFIGGMLGFFLFKIKEKITHKYKFFQNEFVKFIIFILTIIFSILAIIIYYEVKK